MSSSFPAGCLWHTLQGSKDNEADEGALGAMKTINSRHTAVDLWLMATDFAGPNSSHCVAVVALMMSTGTAASSA